MTKLQIRNLSKRFGGLKSGFQALFDVSLNVESGEFLMIVGPSGSGKSTLLNIIAGLETPDVGDVLIDGRAVTGPGPDRSLVFQDGALFPWLDVRRNVEFGLKQARVPSAERRDRAQKTLERVGLKGFEDHAIHELSSGLRQRVALARSLVLSPKVILMDEPFSALDAPIREDLYLELQELRQDQDATFVFVTHNIREAVTLGDRVVLMSPDPGRIHQVYEIDIMRPRQIDDIDVARQAQTISAAMKRRPNASETFDADKEPIYR